MNMFLLTVSELHLLLLLLALSLLASVIASYVHFVPTYEDETKTIIAYTAIEVTSDTGNLELTFH